VYAKKNKIRTFKEIKSFKSRTRRLRFRNWTLQLNFY